MRKSVLRMLVIFLALSLTPSAFADVEFGDYARSSAMGGAGLAVLDNKPLVSDMINPAAMNLVQKQFDFEILDFDLRIHGGSIHNLIGREYDALDLNTDSAIALARDFAGQTTQLGANIYTAGVSFDTFAIGLGGQAVTQIVPNKAFIKWAKGDNTSANALAARAAVTGNTTAFLPSFSIGWSIPQASGKMYMGVRGRLMRSTHFEQNVKLTDPTDGSINVVQDGVRTKVDDHGFGMDFGMLVRPEGPHQTTYGLVVTNLLRPALNGIRQDRMFSLGFATKPSKKFLIAADLVNISRAFAEPAKLRMGVEFQPARHFALRAGYSGSDLTYGFDIFGFNFAFSSETPMTIAQTLRF